VRLAAGKIWEKAPVELSIVEKKIPTGSRGEAAGRKSRPERQKSQKALWRSGSFFRAVDNAAGFALRCTAASAGCLSGSRRIVLFERAFAENNFKNYL